MMGMIRPTFGELPAHGARRALQHYGIDMGERAAAEIVAAYDERPDGKLDVYEVRDLTLTPALALPPRPPAAGLGTLLANAKVSETVENEASSGL